MAATSEEFKAALKEGRIVDALKTALGQSIELEITTAIASDNPEIGSRTWEKGDSGEIMRTRLNIVEGKIETEIGSKFLEGEKFAELREFHVSQMQASGQIIERNISSLQKLLELWVGMQQTVVVPDRQTHSPELNTIQPDALASGRRERPAAVWAPDQAAPKTEQTKPTREPELPKSADDDAEVLAAFELEEPSTDDMADGLAFNTEVQETAAPSAEKGQENSGLKTAAVVAGTAAVVGTAAAAAAAVWGSREDEAASDTDLTDSDLTDSEALGDLDIDEVATDPTADPLGETEQELTSSWDETELPPSEELAVSESILEPEPVTEDSELEMMDGTEQLASSWDETELLLDQPEPELLADTFVESATDSDEPVIEEPESEAIEPDLLAQTLVEPLIDESEPVIEDSTEDSEVEIMGAFETEESESTPAKEDETAEILGSLETEEELAASWDSPELADNTEAESLALGIDEESADLMGTAEEELAASWEEPETTLETESDSEWPTDLSDESLAEESVGSEWPTDLSDESLTEESAGSEWPTDLSDESLAEESVGSEWPTDLSDESLAEESAGSEWPTDLSDESLAEESVGSEWPTDLSDESLAEDFSDDSFASEGSEWPTALQHDNLVEEASEWPTDLSDESLVEEAVEKDETDEYGLPMDASDAGLADVFDSSQMDMADELGASESASDGEFDSLWDSSETQEAQATEDELPTDWENQADPFGDSVAAPLGSDEDLPLWEESETDPLAGALEEVPGEAAGDDLENLWGEEAALGESQELELPDSQSDVFAEADNADPFFGGGMSSDEGLLELEEPTDEDAALMSAFDSDGEADMGFDEPQPYPGTTGADLGLNGEVLDDVFSSSDISAAEFATEESQAASEASGSMFNTEDMALDEFDVDMFGESEPQGNGTKKATATAGDNGSDDEEFDDPLAALLADADDDADEALGQAGAFESEAEFDPLAELFAESDQELDLNSGGAETDELDALFDDDVNGGNLEDPFADLELAESPSKQTKKKR